MYCGEPSVGIFELRGVAGVGNDLEPRARDGAGHRVRRCEERCVLFADDHECRARDGRERGEVVVLVRNRTDERGPHDLRQRVPLAVLELLVTGTFGEHAFVGRVSERVGEVEQLLQRRLALHQRDIRRRVHQLGIEVRDRTGRGVHQDQRLDPLRMYQHDPARHHAAHRVAEQAEPVEPDPLRHRHHVGDEAIERIGRRITRRIALTVAAVVGRHHRVSLGQHLDVIGEVLLGAAEPVHEEQARSTSGHLDRQFHPVVHRDAHGTIVIYDAVVAPDAPVRAGAIPGRT